MIIVKRSVRVKVGVALKRAVGLVLTVEKSYSRFMAGARKKRAQK